MLTRNTLRWSLRFSLMIATSGLIQAQETASTPEGIKFFETKIRPVLVDNCYRCPSSDGQQGVKGGLSVVSRDSLAAGGESGAAIVPGHLEDSMLWNAINYRDFKMPPKKPLPKEVIEDFRKWIEMGAPDPRDSTGTLVKSTVSPEDIVKGKEFWAFKKPVLRVPASSSSSTWPKTEIDQFIATAFDEHSLQPAADADPNTLVRRLYFDLIGLPPSPEAVNQFRVAWQKDSESAIASVVDSLLERPQFGERWGRFWLDIARYAESSGKEVDVTFPHAWRYRNYVIDSFNQDKPYDEFVREQIAGDLLPAKSDEEWAEHLIATGFLALGPKALIERNPRQFQADLVDEQIDVTTRVILGVSVACARCHDHKFDPIPQTDYYAIAGIFQSTETLFGGTRSQRNRQPSNLTILPIDNPNPGTEAISMAELAELKQQLKKKEVEYDEAQRAQRQTFAPSNGKTGATDPRVAQRNLALVEQAMVQLISKINSVDSEGKPLSFSMGVQETGRMVNARVLVRGEIDQPAQEVSRGLVQVMCDGDSSLKLKSGSGRLELAQWLTARDNPLTARVMVNRIWQHLIGQAIVRETENFGASGPGPTHPELLDYLAIKFMDGGWSIKNMIREVAQSGVYRLSSQHDAARFESDPENLYAARANPRRLDAESMRDAMLFVSGQIELERPKASVIAPFGSTQVGPNGPQVIPTQILSSMGSAGPEGMMGAILQGMRSGFRPGGGNVLEARSYYRSVYLPVVRNAVPRAMDVFDFAEPSMVIGQRETSSTADQALFMLNNPFVHEQSDAFARRLIRESDNPRGKIEAAFQIAYGRPATEREMNSSIEFLGRMKTTLKAPSDDQRAFMVLSQFCQALMSSAEFRFVN